MADVLLVSKPLAPPWTDGAKNLARDLACYSRGPHRLRCLVPRGSPAPGGQVAEPIYGGPGGYAPGLRQNLRVLARLAAPDRVALYHFFFAPNPRTSTVAGALMRLKRRPTVHTVVSRPSGGPPLFADVHVALSDHTATALRAAGARDVRVIRPGIAPDGPTPDVRAVRRHHDLPLDRPLVLFAGDLTAEGGAEAFADATLAAAGAFHAVFACRPKGSGHAERRASLAARLGPAASWLGEIADMPALAASVDAQCLPATDLHAKMDLPMVLIEGLRAGVPAVVSDVPPLREMGTEASGVLRCTRGALAKALTDLLEDPARRAALGRAAAAGARARYDAGRMAAEYQAIYEELLSR